MAGRPTGWAYEHVITGDPNTKSVLVALADNADHDGYCYPSQELLAKKTELSVSTVKRKLKILEQFGVVVVTRKKLGEQKRRNFYRLALGKAFDLRKAREYSTPLPTGVTVTPVKDEEGGGPANSAPAAPPIFTGSTVTPVNSTGGTVSPVADPQGSGADTCDGLTGLTVIPEWVHQVNHEPPYNLTTTAAADAPHENQGQQSGPDRIPGQQSITLDLGWQPNDYTFQRLAFTDGIPEDFARKSLIGFVEYHNGAQRRQAHFEKSFSHWVREDWSRRGRDSDGDSDAGPGLQRKLQTLTSRSWAE